MLRILSFVTALLPVLMAAAAGRLPQMPGFAVGVFVIALVGIWMPGTRAVATVLGLVGGLAALAYGVSSCLHPEHRSTITWAAVFLGVMGLGAGVLTQRTNPAVAMILSVGAVCGLNAPVTDPALAVKGALFFALGGGWSLLCTMGLRSRNGACANLPSKPVAAKGAGGCPSYYPVRYGAVLCLALLAGHWLWTSHLGWAPAAAAAVLRPDLAVAARRSIGRVVATLGGVIIAATLLALHLPALPSLLLLLILLCGAIWFRLDPLYAIPLFATSLVLTLYGQAQSGMVGQLFLQRVAENAVGMGIAWVLLILPPSIDRGNA